jgi:hypothetical protein
VFIALIDLMRRRYSLLTTNLLIAWSPWSTELLIACSKDEELKIARAAEQIYLDMHDSIYIQEGSYHAYLRL